ncbi:MAG: hypothetical protein ACM33V_01920 [Chloroflexota bacterium]|nr:hypothetical protein [Anaerolineales bacterium]
MRKSTIFISAVLTTFALVMLYRVAAAYNNTKTATQIDTPTSLPEPTETEPPATEPPAPAPADVVLGPEQAANLAAQVIGSTDLLSAESSNFNGTSAYMVTFVNNDVVYVGLDGQILSVQIAPPTPVLVNVSAPTQKKHKSNGGGGSTSSSTRDNHEDDNRDDHDEHEDHDDD